MILADTLQKFLNLLGRLERTTSTITAYSKDIEQLHKYLQTSEKVESIENVTTQHLNNYLVEIRSDKKNNYTLKTVSRKINSMKTYFKFLLSENIILSDPAQLVKHPKYKVSPPRLLSKMEYRALRDVSRLNPRLYTIVELLLQTGLRIGELARLRVEDVILEGNPKRLKVRKYASNKKRNAEINEPAASALKHYLKIRPEPNEGVNSLFVTKNGNPLLVRNIRTSISRAFEKAGIKDTTVNDIRNTFIIHQLRNGMPVEMVGKIVGHKRLTSTSKYLKLVKVIPKRKITKIVPL